MKFSIWDGNFDVAIVSGPRITNWPSVGIQTLSALCSEAGLAVGFLGGTDLTPHGVIPLPGTGGVILAEDQQRRIHRISARAVVRLVDHVALPDPFPGWRMQGLVPLNTALRLRKESRASWRPATVILGTGNPAIRLGSSILESGDCSEVICVESFINWGKKRVACWEVEKRRFEMLGGRIIEAVPVELTKKSALLWQLQLKDHVGISTVEAAWVISAGPFGEQSSVREYPPGSLLFEMVQTSLSNREEDIEGWAIEEERGRYLAVRIVKALVDNQGEKRERFEKIFRRAKGRLKTYTIHREEPFELKFDGKWVMPDICKTIRSFSGVPQEAHKARAVASLECFENIPCNVCEKICPSSAIKIVRGQGTEASFLLESDCTACGQCLVACPSGAIVMIHEEEEKSVSRLTFPWRGRRRWKIGDFTVLLNRHGEKLGTGRVSSLPTCTGQQSKVQLVQIEVPTHLVWEVRGMKYEPKDSAVDDAFMAAYGDGREGLVEITLDGEKRMVRNGITISVALFEIGRSRHEDVLLCPDGSCHLCLVLVDGVKKLACQTKIHQGMAIKLLSDVQEQGRTELCTCQKITRDDVIARLEQGQLKSPEAVLSVTRLGEGKCHGQLCMGAFQRLMAERGLDVSQWIDWRFPWSEWVLSPGPRD